MTIASLSSVAGAISIPGEVLIENGIVGGIGALLAMLLVTLATSLLEQFIFKTGFCTLLVAERTWLEHTMEPFPHVGDHGTETSALPR